MENVYKAKSGNRILSIVVGLVLIGVAGWFLSSALGRSDPPTALLIGPAVLILLGLLIVWFGGLRPSSIALTNEALEVRRGKRVAQRYPYSDMEHVRMVARREAYRKSRVKVGAGGTVSVPLAAPRFKLYPELQIEGSFSYPYILPLNFKGPYVSADNSTRRGNFSMNTPYDTDAIVRDLVSRLPSSVEVDASVRGFAASGEFPDATTLPEEMRPLPGFLGGS